MIHPNPLSKRLCGSQADPYDTATVSSEWLVALADNVAHRYGMLIESARLHRLASEMAIGSLEFYDCVKEQKELADNLRKALH